jgi:hypothetical protein
MQASLEKARKQMETLAAQGGPAAAMARQQLARMGPPPAAGNNWLLEMTIDFSDFSAAPIAESAFDIPAGYQKR